MDIIFEIITQIIFEGTLEATRSSKLPLWLRWILAVVVFGMMLLFGGILVYGGIGLISKNLIAGISLAILGVGMVIFSIYQIFKFAKSLSGKNGNSRQKTQKRR